MERKRMDSVRGQESGEALYLALARSIIARILETPAKCEPEHDVRLRLEAIILEREQAQQQVAELQKEHELDLKMLKFYRHESVRIGLTAKVDINGWPIQLINERADELEQQVATLTAERDDARKREKLGCCHPWKCAREAIVLQEQVAQLIAREWMERIESLDTAPVKHVGKVENKAAKCMCKLCQLWRIAAAIRNQE